MSDDRFWGIVGILAAIIIGAGVISALTPPGQKLINRINQELSQVANIVKSHVSRRKAHPQIRKTASELVSQREPNDFVGQISDIHRFVADGIRYIHDPVSAEHISDPLETLYVKAGDCDCKSLLLTTLLESIGYKCYMVLVNPLVEISSARILKPGHAFVVTSIPDPNEFRKREENTVSMILCERGTPTKYLVPLETTVSKVSAGWLSEDIIEAIHAGRYRVIDPDAPPVMDQSLSLRLF